MWRRFYLLFALVRLWFALSSSYLHPDENFQGPEVIAGQIFSYSVKHTWEFTSDAPIRSLFPLWPVYGLPMLLLRWLWLGDGSDSEVAPIVVFWTLRVLMFLLSFVLEDWAILELVQTPRQKRRAILLVASSYVTWTYQTHTFSNSLETLLVLWSLVLIQRIVNDKYRNSGFASAVLAFLLVSGVFTRITFPAFVIIPGLRLLKHFQRRPLSLLIMVSTGLFTLFCAIATDTEFYTKGRVTWAQLFTNPIITPWNNLRYNLESSNLALHGIHPRYQHILGHLPLLLGPAFPLLLFRPHLSFHLSSAISGILVLSLFQHQEARFLLPAIPLLLSSIEVPNTPKYQKIWGGLWIAFNLVLGLLMGTYHQGGIVPAQVFLSHQADVTQAAWWKTYSPPIWLLDGKSDALATHDLMGMKGDAMIDELKKLSPCSNLEGPANGTYLVAPSSASFLDSYMNSSDPKQGLTFEQVWHYRQHLNLDDLDFGDDGVLPTLQRVVGRRGLDVWRITRTCT